MAIVPSTLDSSTPRTYDGRSYPDHLRPYEAYDEELLPLISSREGMSPSEISQAIEDRRLRLVLARWMASAEWRGLIERQDSAGRRVYVLGERGRERLAESR